ncbi:ABC transporter permease [Marinobacter sp. X15-166B]|uniref:ABC transporter permease n=1 Tax=Marinobacter sp. X15-166B TaxID=1897620 RepID=UPI00085CD121|nr:ABC transporter permease [Marinobacter sp. X15-166B]OEY67482.1 peptide ABC transporter permease [Marinobacter sp. X15-166B]
MKIYLIQRLAQMLVILLGVLMLTFVLSRILPGSPVEMMLGHRPSPEQIEAVRTELGLDKPIAMQFMVYLKGLAQGDLGTSLHTGQPVTSDLFNRFGATFELTTIALLLVVVMGIPLGVVSAVRQNTLSDHLVRSGSIAGMALPVFLIAMLLQMLFYGQLGWFPLQGRINAEIALDYPFAQRTGLYLVDTLLAGQWPAFKSAVLHLVLPVFTLVMASIAVVTRITRNTMVEVLQQDHIRTLQAYGVSRRRIYYRYALKATLIPLLTVIGLAYGYMLGGSVVVEFIFDWPGMGGYAVGGITRNDFPAVMGVTLLLAVIYLSMNLVIDLLYHLVDPRLELP